MYRSLASWKITNLISQLHPQRPKVKWTHLLNFLYVWTSYSTNSGVAGDLKRHGTHVTCIVRCNAVGYDDDNNDNDADTDENGNNNADHNDDVKC